MKSHAGTHFKKDYKKVVVIPLDAEEIKTGRKKAIGSRTGQNMNEIIPNGNNFLMQNDAAAHLDLYSSDTSDESSKANDSAMYSESEAEEDSIVEESGHQDIVTNNVTKVKSQKTKTDKTGNKSHKSKLQIIQTKEFLEKEELSLRRIKISESQSQEIINSANKSNLSSKTKSIIDKVNALKNQVISPYVSPSDSEEEKYKSEKDAPKVQELDEYSEDTVSTPEHSPERGSPKFNSNEISMKIKSQKEKSHYKSITAPKSPPVLTEVKRFNSRSNRKENDKEQDLSFAAEQDKSSKSVKILL